MRAFFAVGFLIALLCTVESCREGCKDKNALNYDSRAKVENASCLYCSSSFIIDTATYFFSVDSAPVQQAIEFILTVSDSATNGNGCGTVGKVAGNNCINYLRMINLTNKTASGFINLTFDQNGFTAFDWSGSVQIGPRDTINLVGLNSDTCANTTTGTLAPNLFNLVFN